MLYDNYLKFLRSYLEKNKHKIYYKLEKTDNKQIHKIWINCESSYYTNKASFINNEQLEHIYDALTISFKDENYQFPEVVRIEYGTNANSEKALVNNFLKLKPTPQEMVRVYNSLLKTLGDSFWQFMDKTYQEHAIEILKSDIYEYEPNRNYIEFLYHLGKCGVTVEQTRQHLHKYIQYHKDFLLNARNARHDQERIFEYIVKRVPILERKNYADFLPTQAENLRPKQTDIDIYPLGEKATAFITVNCSNTAKKYPALIFLKEAGEAIQRIAQTLDKRAAQLNVESVKTMIEKDNVIMLVCSKDSSNVNSGFIKEIIDNVLYKLNDMHTSGRIIKPELIDGLFDTSYLELTLKQDNKQPDHKRNKI